MSTDTGQVKYFNAEKGFGFIAPDEGGPDIFFHKSVAETAGIRNIGTGDTVGFEVGLDKKTKRTKAVRLWPV